MSNPASTLAQIDRRVQDCRTYNFGLHNADTLAHKDAPKMLAALRAALAEADAMRRAAAVMPDRPQADALLAASNLIHDAIEGALK